MKTIGLLGGMSWESTLLYYQVINRTVAEKLGGLHSAKLLLHSVDFAGLEENLRAGAWDKNADILSQAGRGLVAAGAELLAICTNTMHKVAPEVQRVAGVPLVHIADAAADELQARQAVTVALLGTRFTMQEQFYKEKLWARGFEVLLPTDWQMEELDRIIFEELCRGVVSESARTFVLALINELAGQGAQAAVLGCTELPLLVKQADTATPLLDTTGTHARRIALAALKD